MQMIRSILLKLSPVLLIATLLTVITFTPMVKATGHEAPMALLVTLTPSPTSLTSSVSVTVEVIPTTTLLTVGEPLSVAVHIYDHSTEGCYFVPYDLTLSQQGDDAPIFGYVSPPVVGPPVSNPTPFTLTAITTGTVILRASAYGEMYCGFWQWTYFTGESGPIVVALEKRQIYLPIIIYVDSF